ncbi:hypothetical protein NPIL_190301, partial [Nephila pilipes]
RRPKISSSMLIKVLEDLSHVFQSILKNKELLRMLRIMEECNEHGICLLLVYSM